MSEVVYLVSSLRSILPSRSNHQNQINFNVKILNLSAGRSHFPYHLKFTSLEI